MGIVLMIFSILSAIPVLIALILLNRVINSIQNIYEEIGTLMPYSTNYTWILLIILLIISILTFFYGRILYKHPELNKKYLWFSIFLLIVVIIGIDIGLQYSFFPILMNIYNIANTV